MVARAESSPLSVAVEHFQRTGYTVDWKVTVSYGELRDGCSSSSCEINLSFFGDAGWAGRLTSFYPMLGSAQMVVLEGRTEIRSRVTSIQATWGQLAASPQVSIDDGLPSTNVSVAIHTADRYADQNRYAATVYFNNLPRCGADCALKLIGRTAGGDGVILGQSTALNPYGGSVEFETDNRAAIVELKASWGAASEVASSAWTPVALDIIKGHSVSQAAAKWAAAESATTERCIEYLPVGPHAQGSSLNDYQLECESGVQAGLSMAQIFANLVATFGADRIGAWLAQHNEAQNPARPTSETAPEALEWPGYSGLDGAVDEDENRSGGAPPRLDGIFERSLVGQRLHNGRVENYGFDTAQPASRQALEVMRQCVALAHRPGALFSEDDCASKPIFSPGSDVLEATRHDADAQLINPSWGKLHYQSRASKALTGVPNTWYNQYVCDGTGGVDKQCDEFPFYASLEGGPGTSLRYIDAEDNAREGRFYSYFLRACGLPSGDVASDDSEFLVVPIPLHGGPKTSAWCAR